MSSALGDSQERGGTWLSRFLDITGDSTGSTEQAINAAAAPVYFKYTVPLGFKMYVYSLLVALEDEGNFVSPAYGGGVVLTNGIELGRMDTDGNFISATQQVKILKNTDWMRYTHEFQIVSFKTGGAGSSILSSNYSFEDDGIPVQIFAGESFAVKINDDLTGLTSQKMRIGAVVVPHN